MSKIFTLMLACLFFATSLPDEAVGGGGKHCTADCYIQWGCDSCKGQSCFFIAFALVCRTICNDTGGIGCLYGEDRRNANCAHRCQGVVCGASSACSCTVGLCYC